MPRRVPIPPALRGRAFAVAAARELGVGEGRLASADLSRPFHGVRSVAAPVTVLERCRAFLPRMRPTECFSHVTAAVLWGCPLPRAMADMPLHVSGTARASRSRGVIGHQLAHPERAVPRYGVPVAPPASMFLQMAPLVGLDDLVAIADHLVLDPAVLDPRDIRPYLDLAALRSATSGSYRGARAAKLAAELARQGAESRPETLLRLLVIRAGLPHPDLNAEIEGRGEGRGWRYRVDLVFAPWKVAVEYDGDQHRTDTAQYERDIRRYDDLTAAGWTVIRVRTRGLFVDPDDTVARVTHALEARGWRAL